MDDTRQITCINCPLGCTLDVVIKPDNSLVVTGFQCERGEAYAKKEILHPMRTITSSVPVTQGEYPMVSVKTAGEIPKNMITNCMLALKDIVVEAPIHIGDVVVRDVCSSGIDIVATREVKRKP